METDLQIPSEASGGLQRELRVKIPVERVTQAVDLRLRNIAQRAKLPGFRPGKAPFKVIQQQYGMSARLDAISDLVQQTYPEAVVKSGARPAGQPSINIVAEQPGEPLEYTASFEVYPEIQISGLDALEVEKPVVEVTDEDVERLIENLRKGRRTTETTDRAAASGDIVKVDFDGKLDGESFAGGQGNDVQIELGSGQFLPDLEAGIVGHSAGEQFEVAVSFPADYRAEALQGKTAQFQVTLKEVQAVVLPSVEDAEFLEAHKVDSAEALRTKAREALEQERKKAIQRREKAQVMEQLAEKNPIEVPAQLADEEADRVIQSTKARLAQQGVADFPVERETVMPEARRRVALGLVVHEVVRANEIKTDDATVRERVDEMAASYERPEEFVQWHYADRSRLANIEAMVLEDQVVEFLLESASVTDKTVTFEEFVNATGA